MVSLLAKIKAARREGSFTAQIEMKESVIMSHLFPGSGGPELEHLPELVPSIHGAVEVALVERLAGVPLHILACTAQSGDGTSETQQLISSAANRLIGDVIQSRRRPLLGPSPG